MTTTSDRFRVEGDKNIASRSWRPLHSAPHDKMHWWGTPGQDGYSYLVEGYFDHEFVPYISGTTGEPNGGCDTCGWHQRTHASITHVECDQCHTVVPNDEHLLRISSREVLPGFTGESSGTEYPSFRMSHVRYFCSEPCSEQWFQELAFPDETC